MENSYLKKEYGKLYNLVPNENEVTDPTKDLPIISKINTLNFETITQNLGSYPYLVDSNDPKKIIKIWDIGNNKKIKLITDISNPNMISYLLTGDTGLEYDIKKITIKDNLISLTKYNYIKKSL